MTARLSLVPPINGASSNENAATNTGARAGLHTAQAARSRTWVHDAWVPASRHTPGRAVGLFRRVRAAVAGDRGAVTAEYAIVIMAAVAFAGLLVAIMRSGEIRAMLVQLVESALSAAG